MSDAELAAVRTICRRRDGSARRGSVRRETRANFRWRSACHPVGVDHLPQKTLVLFEIDVRELMPMSSAACPSATDAAQGPRPAAQAASGAVAALAPAGLASGALLRRCAAVAGGAGLRAAGRRVPLIAHDSTSVARRGAIGVISLPPPSGTRPVGDTCCIVPAEARWRRGGAGGSSPGRASASTPRHRGRCADAKRRRLLPPATALSAVLLLDEEPWTRGCCAFRCPGCRPSDA